MLNEAVKQLKGGTEEEIYTTVMDLNVDAYIPNSYIPNEYQKLDIYKRIAGIEDEEEMDDMLEELIDRFGDVPRKVQQLLQIAGLKALAHSDVYKRQGYHLSGSGNGSGEKASGACHQPVVQQRKADCQDAFWSG